MTTLMQVLENDLKYVETLAETKVLPWVEAVLTKIEHDFVTAALPLVETAGAQVAVDLVSGQPIAAIEDMMVALVKQTAQNMLKVGVQTTAQDFSATITAYLAGLAKTGAAATAAQPNQVVG